MAKKNNTSSYLVDNLKKEADPSEGVLQEDGSLVFTFEDDPSEVDDYNASIKTDPAYTEERTNGHYRNLVSELDEEQLTEISRTVLDAVTVDQNSRSSYMKDINLGLELLGIKIEEKNTPFQGACSAQHPLLMESAVKFQSKASSELLPTDGPVRTKILGEITPEKEDKANRIKKHLNWQITEQMTEFFVDSEKLLLNIPIIGSGFKKAYYDSYLERPVSEFVPMDQFVVPNNCSDLERAPRYTHIIYRSENKFKEDCASGFYYVPEDYEFCPYQYQLTEIQQKLNSLQGIQVSVDDDSGGYTLYEHYCDLYIEGLEEDEGDVRKYKLGLPYIVTVDHESELVVGIRRNWAPEDTKRKRKTTFVHYTFVPGFGFYGIGFIHLLGNLQLTLTAALRSLVDAGQFANLQGGFKLKGVRVVDDGDPIGPGEFKEIESTIQDINKAIMPLPFKGADQTLFAMLQFLTAAGQKFADSTEQVIADSTNYGPVGTTMALLDASTKFFSAIHKRLHLSQKQELKAIAKINSETIPDNYAYNIENESVKVSREDYDETTVDVVPVSDPNISSNAHRMAKAQTLFQFAQQAPEGVFDMREVMRHVLVNLDYGNLDKILPNPEEAQPQDAITDIRLAVEGKPIKAFEGQEHDAHIQIKTAFLQNPSAGANPIMQRASVSLEANIQEHMLLKFISQTQAQAANGQVPLEQAAQQIAQLNQQEQEARMKEAQGNDAERLQSEANMILAQAELKSAENDTQEIGIKAQISAEELRHKYAALEVEKLKEINKMLQVDKKLANDIEKIITTKSLDAIIEGLRPLPKQKISVEKKDRT